MKFKTLPNEDKWKIDILKELVNVKQHVLRVDFDNDSLSIEEIDDMINFITTS